MSRIVLAFIFSRQTLMHEHPTLKVEHMAHCLGRTRTGNPVVRIIIGKEEANSGGQRFGLQALLRWRIACYWSKNRSDRDERSRIAQPFHSEKPNAGKLQQGKFLIQTTWLASLLTSTRWFLFRRQLKAVSTNYGIKLERGKLLLQTPIFKNQHLSIYFSTLMKVWNF